MSFPDASRSALDRAIGDLVDRANDVLATQGRLRALLRANHAVVEDLDLPVVLRRIVDVAVELVGARYGAVGVIDPRGGLEQFIHVGMSESDAQRIGHLPEGHGLLGALIDEARPIRLPELSTDPRASGFPPGHPPMGSFLGVPIRVQDEMFGNLYLTDAASGAFTDEDEQLVLSLAATAGLAIQNARLYAETMLRQGWTAASADLTSLILAGDPESSLRPIADRIRSVSLSDLVYIARPGVHGSQLTIDVARGASAEHLEGSPLDAGTSLAGRAMAGGQPRIIDAAADDELPGHWPPGFPGPTMVVPLRAETKTLGALVLARARGGARYRVIDLEMAADLAAQVSVAMELAEARADQQRMTLLEDRGRIARDLHDHVIQELFATGLQLQSIAGTLPERDASRVLATVEGLDASIAQIRAVVFALTTRPSAGALSVRHRMIDLVGDMAESFPRAPAVSFAGAVDLLVAGALAEDVVAVTREAVTNAAKHADADTVAVALAVVDSDIVLRVSDDGRGIPERHRSSGLANMAARARTRGGRFDIETGAGGTTITWSVPVADDQEEPL